MKIYKVLNPQTGAYTDASTLLQCLNLVAENAYNFYLSHTHGAAFSIVNIDAETGAETWSNPAGDTILNPTEIQEQLVTRFSQSLPVTILGDENVSTS